jgi:hypothetical protein
MSNLSSGKRKNEVRVIYPNEPTPIFIAARAIGKAVVGLSPKTLANWRSYGRGPKYYLKNGSVYYKFEDLENFFGENPVETDEEKGKSMEDGNAYKCL